MTSIRGHRCLADSRGRLRLLVWVWCTLGTALVLLLRETFCHSGVKDILGTLAFTTAIGGLLGLTIASGYAICSRRSLRAIDLIRVVIWTLFGCGMGLRSRGYFGYFWPAADPFVEGVANTVAASSLCAILVVTAVDRMINRLSAKQPPVSDIPGQGDDAGGRGDVG